MGIAGTADACQPLIGTAAFAIGSGFGCFLALDAGATGAAAGFAAPAVGSTLLRKDEATDTGAAAGGTAGGAVVGGGGTHGAKGGAFWGACLK